MNENEKIMMELMMIHKTIKRVFFFMRFMMKISKKKKKKLRTINKKK